MNLFLKYIKTVFLSATLIILCSFTLKLLWFKLSSFYLKHNEFKEYRKINIGLFGHSQTLGGLDEKILNNNKLNYIFENFSITGAPLYYTTCLIEYTLSKNPKMDVILEIGTNNVDRRGTVKSIFHENSFFHFKNFFFYILRQDFNFILNNKLIDSVKFLLTCTFNFPSYNFTGFQSWDSKFDVALSNFKIDSIKINENYDSKIKLDFEINRLTEVIRRNPSNNFLLIRLPEHELYQEIFSNSDRYNEVICKLTNFKNVYFRDFVNYQLKKEDFRDLYHLSKSGADKFSRHVLNTFLNLRNGH